MTKKITLSTPEIISKFLKFLEDIESASPLTLKAYKKDLEQAFTEVTWSQGPSFEDHLLTKSAQAMTQWRKLSPASRNRKSASLKSFFNFLHQQKIISKRLSGFIVSTKVPKRIPNYISVDEALAVLKISEGPSRILFLLLYGGGLRVSEACQLQWKNFDFDRGTVRLKGKGNKERLIALPKNILLELAKYKKLKKSVYVFGDQALSPRKAYSIVQNLGAQAGLVRNLHPHALRHSYATHLLSNGANLRVLQELLGHQSLQATEKYTHLSVDQLARTMEKHHPFGRK